MAAILYGIIISSVCLSQPAYEFGNRTEKVDVKGQVRYVTKFQATSLQWTWTVLKFDSPIMILLFACYIGLENRIKYKQVGKSS